MAGLYVESREWRVEGVSATIFYYQFQCRSRSLSLSNVPIGPLLHSKLFQVGISLRGSKLHSNERVAPNPKINYVIVE